MAVGRQLYPVGGGEIARLLGEDIDIPLARGRISVAWTQRSQAAIRW